MPNRICIYHKDCSDGKGAALAVWLRFGDSCLYHPAANGDPPPYEVWGRDVVLVDFCYPPDTMQDLSHIANSIIVLDHHKTSLQDLQNQKPLLQNTKLIFDLKKSGAALAWNYFHKQSLPTLLWHIQDRDLSQYKSVNTKGIVEGLKHYPDFRDWQPFLDGTVSLQVLQNKGESILDFVNIEAKKALQSTTKIEIGGHIVPLYNLPDFMVCDTLAMALQEHPDAPFAASYYDRCGCRTYSLRSRQGHDVDVGEVAKKFGGGGHKHSAGFVIHRVKRKG